MHFRFNVYSVICIQIICISYLKYMTLYSAIFIYAYILAMHLFVDIEIYVLEIEIKEELHNRFNLISEERVKFFKHNSENLMKIG